MDPDSILELVSVGILAGIFLRLGGINATMKHFKDSLDGLKYRVEKLEKKNDHET